MVKLTFYLLMSFPACVSRTWLVRYHLHHFHPKHSKHWEEVAWKIMQLQAGETLKEKQRKNTIYLY